MKKFITAFSVMLAVFMPLLSVAPTSADTFNPSRVIDDGIFDNYSSMDAAAIDTWLNTSFPSSCISSNNGFTTPNPQGWSSSQNKYLFGGNVTAGQAIHDVALLYHVNPQVILSTLQKEQAIPNGGAGCYPYTPDPNAPFSGTPSSGNTFTCNINNKSQTCTYACIHSGGCMNIALGYGCPYYCAAADEGFSMQLTLGTWLLRFGEQRAEGNLTGYAGYESGDEYLYYSGPMTPGTRQRSASSTPVYYDGSYTTVDGTTVTISTGSTATLYNFTPYISGNQKFFNIYEGWFGSTAYSFGNIPSASTGYAKAPCTIPNFDTSQVGRLYQPDNQDYLYTTNSTEACSAVKLGYIWDGVVMQNIVPGTGIIPIYRISNLFRHFFTADSAVRADYINNRGYHDEGVAFYAYSSQLANTLPAYGLTNGINSFFTSAGAEGSYFVSHYGYQSQGISFYTPSMNVASQPVQRLVKSNVRFYTISPSEASYAQSLGYTVEGNVSADDPMPSQNSLPVYRLGSSKSHLLTVDRMERDLAIINYAQSGEGIAFYSPSATVPGVQSIYRTTNYSTDIRLFTASLAESNNSRTFYGYSSEGTAWYSY